jgi:peptide/nickel transport system permease protein
MRTYVIRRLLLMVPTILLVGTLTFGMLRLIPGDALMAQISSTSGTAAIAPEQLDAIRRDMGLNGSIPQQFGRYVANLVQGNWGKSYVSKQNTVTAFTERLTTTAELGLLAISFSLLIGVPIGVISALRQNGPLDYLGRMVAIAGLAVPNFWLGLVVIVIASRQFHYAFPKGSHPLLTDPVTNLQQFLIPALILSFSSGAVVMRLTRTTMLEVWRQDFVRTAHAKGLTGRAVVTRHALRNALLPVVTVVGTQLTALVGGAVIVESLFTLRGVGLLTLQAISQRDYPQVQTNVLIFSTVLVAGNLLTDLVYSVLDPRIRYS